MAIPELDLKKVNLQSAVAYLISLHDNEVDWNLLGIKVIGAIDALPIPDGDYEYGDAYMVGTSTPYNMYIYTRPDGEVHTEGYWFPIGKFPAPGPQGPKGDGIEQIISGDSGPVQRVDYDSDLGAEVQSTAKLKYTDSTDGSTKTQTFPLTYKMPIIAGKYIATDASEDNDAMTVKVDGTALSLDFISIDKTKQNWVPWYYDGVINRTVASQNEDGNTFVLRTPSGDIKATTVYVDRIQSTTGGYATGIAQIYFGVGDTTVAVTKTSTDTGTLTASVLNRLQQYPNTQINYNNQVYIRQDPQTAPDGTLNFVHIDSVQDGNGGYKATGKCFSITTSTRAWQVIDLNFASHYTHQLKVTDNVTGNEICFTLTNDDAASYSDRAATLIVDLRTASISGNIKTADGISAAVINASGSRFQATYGANTLFQLTAGQMTVEDTVM